MPLSTAGSSVNACADLGADSVWIVGEGASVVIFFGLGLDAMKSVSSKVGKYIVLCSEHCGSKKERKKRKSSTYRADGSIADDDFLCALVQLDWRGDDATNQGQGQECNAREHHFAERLSNEEAGEAVEML